MARLLLMGGGPSVFRIYLKLPLVDKRAQKGGFRGRSQYCNVCALGPWRRPRAVSSAGERSPHTREVIGSIPILPIYK